MMVDIKLDIDRYDGRDYARSDARYCAIYSGRYYLRELPCPQVRSSRILYSWVVGYFGRYYLKAAASAADPDRFASQFAV